MTLRDVLTDDLIRDWAGPRYYERGEGYFFEDGVLHLSERNQWSVRINDQYRICFVFRSGDACQVEIVDYH